MPQRSQRRELCSSCSSAAAANNRRSCSSYSAQPNPSSSAPLLDALHARGFKLDKGYDSTRCHAKCETRGVHPIIPLKGVQGKQPVLPTCENASRLMPRIPRHTQRFRSLYRGRAAVEREFGRLKHDYGLAPLRVRGLARVQLHAELTMLTRLAQALDRVRAVPLAA